MEHIQCDSCKDKMTQALLAYRSCSNCSHMCKEYFEKGACKEQQSTMKCDQNGYQDRTFKSEDILDNFQESGEIRELAERLRKRSEDIKQKIKNIQIQVMDVSESHEQFMIEVSSLLKEQYPRNVGANSLNKSMQQQENIDEQQLDQNTCVSNCESRQDPKLETEIPDCTANELIFRNDTDKRNKKTVPVTSKELQVSKPQKTYFLNPKNDAIAKDFATEFKTYLGQRITIVEASSPDQCKDNLPIALLCRPQTEREYVEIESILRTVPADMHERTAVIYIHVVKNKADLPVVQTAKKVSGIKNVGIILDVGFQEDNVLFSPICPCQLTNTYNSIEAFVEFVNTVI